VEQLSKLGHLLKLLLHGRFTAEQAEYVLRHALPKTTQTLLKQRLPDSALPRVFGYLYSLLEAAVTLVRRTQLWEIVDTVRVILTDAQSYYLYSPAAAAVVARGGRASAGRQEDEEDSGAAVCIRSVALEPPIPHSGVDHSPLTSPDSGYGESDDEEDQVCERFSPSDDVSPNYISIVEYFHAVEGFDACLHRIRKRPLLNLNAVQMLLFPLLRVKDVLKKTVLDNYVSQVGDAITSYTQQLSDEMLKLEDRKSMAGLHKCLDVLLDHARIPDDEHFLVHLRARLTMRLALALKCLRTPNLEKRLHGLSEIKEMIALLLRKQDWLQSAGPIEPESPVLLLQMAQAPSDVLVEWIQQEKVVELIFGEALHDQLVRRCVEVLIFLAMRGQMDSRLLSLMWRASLDKHESVKQAIYGTLVELTAHLPLPLLDELYGYIRSIPHADYTAHTLTLLRGFAVAGISSLHNCHADRRWYGLEELWDLMADSSPVSPELRHMAAGFLADLLTWVHCAPQRQPSLLRCVAQLESGESVPQTLRLLRSMLSALPAKPRKKMDSMAAALEWLAVEHRMLDIFFDEFLRYHQAAAARIGALADTAAAEATALSAAARIASRPAASPAAVRGAGRGGGRPAEAALRAARAEHKEQLEHRIDFLNLCVVNTMLCLTQAQLDVLWNRCVVHGVDAGERDLIFRWVEQARTNSAAIDAESTHYLFTRAAELPPETLTPTGYACIEYLFRWINWCEHRFAQQDQSHVTVLDLPLHGIGALWAAALRSCDEAVGLRAVRFLVLLHHSLRVSPARAHQQQREFVGECMAALDGAAGRLRELDEATMQPITPASLTATPGLERQQLCLRAERCLTLLRLFVVEVEKRTALVVGGAAPRRHGACLRGAPMSVQVMLGGGAPSGPRPTVAVHTNHTVGDLRVKVWRELCAGATAAGEPPPPDPRALRLIAGGRELKEDWRLLGELHLRAPHAVHVILRPEPALPNGPVVGFGAAAAPAPPTDMEVDGAADGSAEVVAQRSVASEEGAHPAQSSITLLEVGDNFDSLFGLLTLSEERLSARAWQLLMMLPTNRGMRAGLAALPALSQPPDWSRLLHDGPCAFKLLYSLQIVDALLQEGEAAAPVEGSAVPATPWVNAFVAHGGLRHLLKLLTAPEDDLLDEVRGSQREVCLVLLLRVLAQFLLKENHPAAATPEVGFVQPAPLETPASSGAPAAASSPAVHPLAVIDPAWTRRSHAPLRDASLASLVREVGLVDHLMALTERVALVDLPEEDDDDARAEPVIWLAELGHADGGAPCDVKFKIVVEALRLLVACALPPDQPGAEDAQIACALIRGGDRLSDWMRSMLLRCCMADVRAETCAALYALARADPPIVEAPVRPPDEGAEVSGGAGEAFEVGDPWGATTALSIFAHELLDLMPPAEDESEHSEQFFELIHTLIAACPGCELPDSTALDIFKIVLEVQVNHPVLERRDAPDDVDEELVGYLRLLLLLVCHDPEIKHLHIISGGRPPLILIPHFADDLFRLPSAAEARSLGALAPPRCKTRTSRALALALLSELAAGEPANLTRLVDLLLAQQLTRGGGAPSASRFASLWHYAPALQERSRCGYVGLKNLGATCYLNSLVQQLFMVPEFRAALLALDIPPPVPSQSTDGSDSPDREACGTDVLFHLQLIFGHLQESEKRCCDTRNFCAAFRDFDNLPINHAVQMDVDEFLNMLFDQLETGLLATPTPKLLQSLFGGAVVNQIIDKAGVRLSERMEPFYVLSIEVKGKASVLDGLAQFVEGEPLEGDNKYKCDDGRYVDATKRCCISALPPVLLLHLKRFEFDFDQMKKMKLYDHCEFPQVIDMAPYTVGYLEAEEAAGADSPPAGEDAGCMYELSGVLVHTGTSDSGHYYSFIKERRTERPGVYPWLHFNDTTVEPFDALDIGKCCFGGVEPVVQWDADAGKPVQRNQIKAHSAYMLFYERVERKPAPAADPEQLSEARDIVGRGAPVEPAVLRTNPVPHVSVPDHIVSEVWDENMEFLRDLYLVDALHFEFLHRVVGMALAADAPADKPDRLSPAMRLGCHFVVETLAHAKDKSTLGEWVLLLGSGLQRSPAACRWFLRQAEEAGWMRSLLLLCTVPEMRTAYEALLLQAAIVLRPHELHLWPRVATVPRLAAAAGAAVLHEATVAELPAAPEEGVGYFLTSPPKRARTDSLPEQAAAEPATPPAAGQPHPAATCVLHCFVALLPEAPLYWRHLTKFFEVALLLARLGVQERGWMIQHRVVSHMADAYMGDESPYAVFDAEPLPDEGSPGRPRRPRMGDKFAPPPVEHMVGLMDLLARASVRHEPQPRSPLSLPGPLLCMAADEYELLCNPALLRRLLKDGLNVPALCDLFQHLCYESRRTSSVVMNAILQGVDSMDNEQLGPYLSCFCHVLQLSDAEQEWRTDWALHRMLNVVSNNMRYKQATASCLRALLGLSADSAPARRWMVHNRELWVEAWVLGGLSVQVRASAEDLLLTILDAERTESPAAAATGPPAQSGAEPVEPAADAGEPSFHPSVEAVYELLMGLLPPLAQNEMRPRPVPGAQPKHIDEAPLPRLAPYFRACAWCALHASQTHAPRLELLLEAYSLRDGCRYECDETKYELLMFWFEAMRAGQAAAARNPAGPPSPPAEPGTLAQSFRRLLDSFVSLRLNDRFVEYNRQLLPALYGLLRCMLDFPEGDACLRVLVSHRNWDWALRYVLVEQADYVQLLKGAEQHDPYSLARAMRGLLRASMAASAELRIRTLSTALASNKLVTNRANVLPLLAYCMTGEEEVATACERGAPAQLCSCLEACGEVLYADARWETLHPILALLAKCASWLRLSAAEDVAAEARRQTALAGWDVAATRQPVLNVLFMLLRPSLGLPPLAGKPGPVPPPALQAACFDVAGLLAAVDDYCSQTIAQTLLQNRARLAPAGPLQAALGALERASAAGAASGRLAELEAVLEAAKLIGPLAGEAEAPPAEPMSMGSNSHEHPANP
jgi:ubiquitin C-terminal hydrolase